MSSDQVDNRNIGVGIAVFVWRSGKFIGTRRQAEHGQSTFAIPGGHLEHGETWEECAKRELMEEHGCSITNVRFVAVTNDLFESGKHYVTIWMEADWEANEPQILEPTRAAELQWTDIKNLPTGLFEPCWSNFQRACPEYFTRTRV